MSLSFRLIRSLRVTFLRLTQSAQLILVHGKSCKFVRCALRLEDTQLISAKFATMFVNFRTGLYRTTAPQELRCTRRAPDLWLVEGRLSSSSWLCQDHSWSCIDLNFPHVHTLCVKYMHSRYLSNVAYKNRWSYDKRS